MGTPTKLYGMTRSATRFGLVPKPVIFTPMP
jgi:hypothetical protein